MRVRSEENYIVVSGENQLILTSEHEPGVWAHHDVNLIFDNLKLMTVSPRFLAKLQALWRVWKWMGANVKPGESIGVKFDFPVSQERLDELRAINDIEGEWPDGHRE